jgi:hypothetical protein
VRHCDQLNRIHILAFFFSINTLILSLHLSLHSPLMLFSQGKFMFVASVSATYSTHLILTALLFRVYAMKRPDFIAHGVYNKALRSWSRFKKKQIFLGVTCLLCLLWQSLRRQAAIARSVYFARGLRSWSLVFFFYVSPYYMISNSLLNVWNTSRATVAAQ